MFRWSHTLYPDALLRKGAAIGSPAECVARLRERFDAGDPARLGSFLEAWAHRRPAARLAGRVTNPGL